MACNSEFHYCHGTVVCTAHRMYRFNRGDKFGSVSTRGADLKYLCRASKHFVTCFLQESVLKNLKFTETVCDKVQVNFPLYTDKKNPFHEKSK